MKRDKLNLTSKKLKMKPRMLRQPMPSEPQRESQENSMTTSLLLNLRDNSLKMLIKNSEN